MLTDLNPPFRFHEPSWPIYTRPRFLSSSRINDAQVRNCLLSDGAYIDEGARLHRAVVGHRQVVGKDTDLADSVLMGADYYDDGIGIGRGVKIRRAIIDKNVHIGAGAVIEGSPDRPDEDAGDYVVRGGIVIIPKGARIPEGAKI